jgi:hypothetical protein
MSRHAQKVRCHYRVGHFFVYVIKNKYSTKFSVHHIQNRELYQINPTLNPKVWGVRMTKLTLWRLEAELREIHEIESHLLYDEFSDEYIE